MVGVGRPTWWSAGAAAVGLIAGAGTAALHGPALLVLAATAPLDRSRAAAGIDALGRAEHTRVARLLGGTPADARPTPRRTARHLLVRIPLGLLGGAIAALLAVGAVAATTMLWSWATQTPWLLDPETVISGRIVALNLLPGTVLLFLAVAGAATVVRWERALDRRLHRPTLRERVAELTVSRAEVVAAVDDERRRIERDLHDGVQQRLVALGLLLGRARRHPDRAPELVAQAHDAAQQTLVELRNVSWRVYPTALDGDGLGAALESVAERSAVPVVLRLDAEDPPRQIRVPAYFVVCEAVTNAVKHAGATRVDVEVRHRDDHLRVTVTDDGRGGADPSGGGLSGLARRIDAVDGRFSVHSPAGGPTTVTADLPYPSTGSPCG